MNRFNDPLADLRDEPATPSRHRRLWLAGTALTALAAVATTALLVQSAPVEAAANAAPPAVPVSVANVVAAEVAPWAEFSGRLEAVERVELRPRVAGVIKAVHFKDGDRVSPGELLFTLDPAPYAAEVSRAEAQTAAAQARATHALGEYKRAVRLMEERAIAQRELDERTDGLREADANLHAAQAALQAARLNLSYCEVRAPISGRIGRAEVTAGNQVAAGPAGPLLATLVSTGPIHAAFDVDEATAARVLRELPAEPAAARRKALERIPVQMGTGETGDTPWRGKLQLVDNQVDAKSGTVRLRALFDNAEQRLLPGQFARVRIGPAQPLPALLVAERAIGTDQSKKFVLVVGADSKVVWREVSLGASVNGLRVVNTGLKAGERVIVNGLQRVRPGSLVAPELVPMGPVPSANASAAASAAKGS